MNRLSLTLGLALMDLGWAYPCSVLLALWSNRPETGNGGLLSSVTILALVLLGAWTTYLLGGRVRTRRAARLAVSGLAGLGALVAVRVDLYPSSGVLDWIVPLVGALATAIGDLTAPVVAFALAGYLWWRGVRLGSQVPGYLDVESAFRWGIGRLVVFGLIMAVSTRPAALPAIEAQTTPYIVGFFFVSLITLALGRLESLRTRTRTPSVNSQWLGVLVVVAAAVVLLALLLGQLLSFDVLLVATRPIFDLLGTVLLVLVYIVAIPLSFIIQWLIYLVLSLIQPNLTRQPPQPQQPSDVDNLLQRFLSEQVPPEVLLALKAVGAALVLGLALWLVARTLTRWRPSSSDADATNEERDSLWSARQLRAILLDWLRRMLRRGQRAPAPTLDAGSTEGLLAPRASVSTVRAMYAELLRRGAALGVARAAATTPYEHLGPLMTSLTPADAIEHLTQAYVRVRYADSSPLEEEETVLREDVERVRPIDAVD